MGKQRILAIDDDHDILDLLKYNLEREGYKVITLDSGINAIAACFQFEPDLVILDIMMLEVNGIEVCKRIRSIRQFKDTFIFFLTAYSESYYQEAALDTGGDDFIEKIMGLRTLTNRISIVLGSELIIRKRDPVIHIGDLQISRRIKSARIGNKDIALSIPEFELLFFFAQNPNKILTAKNLYDSMVSTESLPASNSLDMYIDLLIRKLKGHRIFKLSNGRYTLLLD